MEKRLLELLICPACLPDEFGLQPEIVEERAGDIITGVLICARCKRRFPIEEGLALLHPNRNRPPGTTVNKYETEGVVSSYLWSHYGDLLNDVQASEAYGAWAARMRPHGGISLDAGGAVGRFAFEMSAKCDFAIGLDNSVAFIRAARRLMTERRVTFGLKDEGLLSRDATITLPEDWKSDKVEFIVGDALALPFRRDALSSLSSLNLIDKVPSPIRHLEEMNRVTKNNDAQFLLSDPFSWSTEAADIDQWLGGKKDGPYAGKGLDNVIRLLKEEETMPGPPWRVEETGGLWWKIRTHTNHYELIRSCFVKASR
uniref:Methyltransferase domain-containing protein n=1 Tax=Candidatus Kentrum eta TaxID=2126337 RepID=A0A450UHK5_9GAMM|nr:MAG: Methyltransferase domain-containing protein [Candidatus Kentron sp. H]VFJ92004.1 MAG: Methyltransferase domain-containing protein [Candidatus Kentron sp. H]VFJ98586.1 MAG: Methyltransferase domain-containing protein [Candidatus Kentron sp. H]